MSERKEVKPGMNATILDDAERDEWFSASRAIRKVAGLSNDEN